MIGGGPNIHFSRGRRRNPTLMYLNSLLNKTFLLHVLFIIIFTIIYFVAISINPQQWQIGTDKKKPASTWDKLSAACYNSTVIQSSLGFGGNAPTVDNHWGKLIIIIQSLISLYITLEF